VSPRVIEKVLRLLPGNCKSTSLHGADVAASETWNALTSSLQTNQTVSKDHSASGHTAFQAVFYGLCMTLQLWVCSLHFDYINSIVLQLLPNPSTMRTSARPRFYCIHQYQCPSWIMILAETLDIVQRLGHTMNYQTVNRHDVNVAGVRSPNLPDWMLGNT